MNDDERLEAVRACKWVDEVVFDTPYTPSLQLLVSAPPVCVSLHS